MIIKPTAVTCIPFSLCCIPFFYSMIAASKRKQVAVRMPRSLYTNAKPKMALSGPSGDEYLYRIYKKLPIYVDDEWKMAVSYHSGKKEQQQQSVTELLREKIWQIL